MMCEICKRDIMLMRMEKPYVKKYVVDGITCCHLCYHKIKSKNMTVNFHELPPNVIIRLVEEAV